jgi:hypothetical protein
VRALAFSIRLGTPWGNQIGEKRVMDEWTQEVRFREEASL